jgi:hypothetical protein
MAATPAGDPLSGCVAVSPAVGRVHHCAQRGEVGGDRYGASSDR